MARAGGDVPLPAPHAGERLGAVEQLVAPLEGQLVGLSLRDVFHLGHEVQGTVAFVEHHGGVEPGPHRLSVGA